jgi:hypothetical protein
LLLISGVVVFLVGVLLVLLQYQAVQKTRAVLIALDDSLDFDLLGSSAGLFDLMHYFHVAGSS